jgi:hypothetical protein
VSDTTLRTVSTASRRVSKSPSTIEAIPRWSAARRPRTSAARGAATTALQTVAHHPADTLASPTARSQLRPSRREKDMREAELAQVKVNDDPAQVSTEISAMRVVPLSQEQRRRAAITICDVMGESGETAQTIRGVLDMLDLIALNAVDEVPSSCIAG